MRRLRDGDAVFDDVLAERLRSILKVAQGLRPVALNFLARRRTSTADGQPWGTATANFVRDLRADDVQMVSVVLRSGVSDPDSRRGRGRSVGSGRLPAALMVSSPNAGGAAEWTLSSSRSVAANSVASYAVNSQRSLEPRMR